MKISLNHQALISHIGLVSQRLRTRMKSCMTLQIDSTFISHIDVLSEISRIRMKSSMTQQMDPTLWSKGFDVNT